MPTDVVVVDGEGDHECYAEATAAAEENLRCARQFCWQFAQKRGPLAALRRREGKEKKCAKKATRILSAATYLWTVLIFRENACAEEASAEIRERERKRRDRERERKGNNNVVKHNYSGVKIRGHREKFDFQRRSPVLGGQWATFGQRTRAHTTPQDVYFMCTHASPVLCTAQDIRRYL